MDSQESVATLAGSGDDYADIEQPLPFRLSNLPSIFVLTTHLNSTALSEAENLLLSYQAPLTHNPNVARIFIGKIERKRRAIFDLRALDILTTETSSQIKNAAAYAGSDADVDIKAEQELKHVVKKRRIDDSLDVAVISLDDSSTDSEHDVPIESDRRGMEEGVVTLKPEDTITLDGFGNPEHARKDKFDIQIQENEVVVIKLSWLTDSISNGVVLPLGPYIVYRGTRLSTQPSEPHSPTALSQSPKEAATSPSHQPAILARARADLGLIRGQSPAAFASTTQARRYGLRGSKNLYSHTRRPAMLQETTSEHDFPESDSQSESRTLPPAPDWVSHHNTYSCTRSTPASSPNARFLAQLKIIRTARKLTADPIGVRAYSTAIASIAAYPYLISSTREVLRLPGCESKIAALWSEWQAKNSRSRSKSASPSGTLQNDKLNTNDGEYEAAEEGQTGVLITPAAEALADPKLKVLRLFYEIWGVAEKTAMEFYSAGWRDLDDVTEYGWGSLTRTQQIGVKYYEEFKRKIPRIEVELIAQKVHEAASKVVNDANGVRSCIVGGYRRGKEESGDVDVIISHTDESQTMYLITEIVRVLMDEEWITHELITSTRGSSRGQATLPFRGPQGGGHGFDTLDKALVVWQDPWWEGRNELPIDWTREQVMKSNPNIHRRVDIIVAPWSKIGCAVLGWSAGTTFERDLRRYAKHVKNWKFDSSGIRDRNTAKEIDLESVGGLSKTPEEAEKKVFAGLGLIYREPWERCTG